MIKRLFSCLLSAFLSLQILLINLPDAQADSLSLPAADQMMSLSAPLQPVMLQGLRYDPQKPFQFQFVLEQGDHSVPLNQLREEGMGLVRYFMAAITMPEGDLWVNLSPYEKNRIIADGLEVTRLGSDMLIEDYILKQLSSSLTFPDSKIGRAFWQKIYNETQLRFGRTDIPISTFNKVWIVPEYADVLIKNNTVVILDSHLKVMMEQDYLATKKASCGESCLPVKNIGNQDGKNLASEVMRQIIIPVLEKEVNNGAHFAALRQMFHAVVLAEWYKRNLRNNILNQYYANQHKVTGIDDISKATREKIYNKYLSAYKKGVYNFIREDALPTTGAIIPRKYFAGGLNMNLPAGGLHERWSTAEFSPGDESTWKNGKLSYLMYVNAEPAMVSSNPAKTGIEAIESQDIKFVQEMRDRWTVPDDAPQDVKQLVEQLKFQNESAWLRWVKVETTFGTRQVLMGRVRHYGKITRGGVRYLTFKTLSKDAGDIKDLLTKLEAYHPTEKQRQNLIIKGVFQTGSALGSGMTSKTEAIELEVGGAKGVIYTDDSDLTAEQKIILKRLAFYQYGYLLTKAKLIGPDIDGLASDFGSDSPEMEMATEGHIAALVEEGEQALEWKSGYADILPEEFRKNFVAPPLGSYEKLYKILSQIKHEPFSLETPLLDAYVLYGNQHPGLPMPALATFTGKTLAKGGVEFRDDSTGDGAAEIGLYYFELLGQKCETAAVQGTGKVGMPLAIKLAKRGIKVQYFGDIGLTLYNEDGLQSEWLEQLRNLLKQKKVPLFQLVHDRDYENFFKGIQILSEDAVLSARVDILFPAAIQNVITKEKNNWTQIHAKVVAEAANEPEDAYSEYNLHINGIETLPDSVVNPGGVCVSKLGEQLQALLGKKLTREFVQSLMYTTLKRPFKKYFDSWMLANQGITNPQQRVTLRDIVKREVINQLAKDQMKSWIDQEDGVLSGVLSHFMVPIDADTLLRRIMRLGLANYLLETQKNLRAKILRLLEKNIKLKEARELEPQLDRILPISGPEFRAKRNKVLADYRTIYSLISGEKLSAASQRLARVGISAEGTRELRVELLRKMKTELHGAYTPGTPEYDFCLLLEKSIEKLDDMPRVAALDQNPFDPANNAMTTTDGGIDFDASGMSINQKGEAISQSLTMYGSPWQNSKGFTPVFLKMIPISLPILMGING